MKTDFLILGGGVGGLSAANRLAEVGAEITLLEAGDYPSHKICGEFLSPEALPILEKWEIPVEASISHAQFILPTKEYSIPLPIPAGAITRYHLDEALAKRASQKGATIKTRAKVEKVSYPKKAGEPFIITLASGEEWTTQKLLQSTGRIMGVQNQHPPTFRYIGFKAHFEGIECENRLLMYLAKGAYFGVVSIGKNQVNIAGIIICKGSEADQPEELLLSFLKRADVAPLVKLLAKGSNLFGKWLMAPIPEFGSRNHLPHPSLYLLGDAAGVIPPATGNGLAMGLTSGILAADYALRGEDEGYLKEWKKKYAARISKGMLLHRLYLSPWLAGAIPLMAQLFPALPRYLFKATRG